MASQNIQRLFAIIGPEQVEQYLKIKGWRCQRSADRLSFEMPADDQQEARQLFIPAQASHPRFRSLLPNLIFSLSVIEGRPAIDVANSIADQELPAPSSPVATETGRSQAGTPANDWVNEAEKVANAEWTMQLFNSNSDKSISIESRFSQTSLTLSPGQSLTVRGKMSTTCQVLLASDCELDFSGPTAPNLMLGQPPELERWRQRGWSLAEGLIDYLRSIGLQMQSDVAESAASNSNSFDSTWIEDAVAEFIFLAGAEVGKTELSALRRASARMLMQTWQHVKDQTAEGSDAIFQLARLLMGTGQQVILADSSAADTLVRTMGLDNPVAPQKTVEWLALHSRNL